MRLRIFLLAFLLIFIASIANALEGKVVRVIDGDTVVIDTGSYHVRCRIYGIDAPETPKRGRPGQPYGLEAKSFLEDAILWEIVDFKVTGEKTYNRDVCIIRYGENKKDVGLEMIENGYAWAYRRYLGAYYSKYVAAEEKARRHHLGLWRDPHPVPPWEFRRASREKHKQAQGFRCGKKRYCSQMNSCEEAMFYFHECGVKRLDRDGDGIPCEKLCR